MAEDNFKKQSDFIGYKRDQESAFYQQQELFKQLGQAETNRILSSEEIEKWPNTRLSGIKDDIPKHQPNKQNRQRGSWKV